LTNLFVSSPPSPNRLLAVGGQVQILIIVLLSAASVIQQQFFKYRPTAKPQNVSRNAAARTKRAADGVNRLLML